MIVPGTPQEKFAVCMALVAILLFITAAELTISLGAKFVLNLVASYAAGAAILTYVKERKK